MKQEHFFLSCMCRYVHADTSSGTAHKDEWGLVIMSWPGFLELICHLLPSAFITAVIFCHDYQFLKPNFMMFHIFLITSFVTFVLRLKKCKLLLKWISYIWLEWSLVAVMVQCRLQFAHEYRRRPCFGVSVIPLHADTHAFAIHATTLSMLMMLILPERQSGCSCRWIMSDYWPRSHFLF